MMKILPPIGLVLCVASLALSAGCASTKGSDMYDNHWTERSIGPRLGRAFLSYDRERDGMYRDFQWRQKQDINLTIRRHIFNHNPQNPFEPDEPNMYAQRPPNSILPRPWEYIGFEGLAWGGILYGATGLFLPIPVGSILGTLEEGGGDEFEQGIDDTFHRGSVKTASYMHEDLSTSEHKK